MIVKRMLLVLKTRKRQDDPNVKLLFMCNVLSEWMDSLQLPRYLPFIFFLFIYLFIVFIFQPL